MPEAGYIKVTAYADRRRAGIRFRARTPKIIAVGDLSKDQRAALEADPVLNIADHEPDDDDNGGAQMTDAERANKIAVYVKGLPADVRDKKNPPTVADAEKALGFRPTGEEMRNAWTALKAAT
ncbi:MAG: hypothetical protein JJ926_03840 [Roseitalea sp.]|nr:hypothetical protein [Roseitalea sp.]MBO6950988.1 hypothetical protein [Rhizobiaceae bacterium]MBO6591025.1 hypothetical protein [Roseitalea sp.]MBO6599717.1 hypothetical protein [Roseitalea sp.]MBO6611473.1 hypothetical protein [Roseitalea sp.]